VHAKFNLNPIHENWAEYFYAGSRSYEENKNIVEMDLKKFKNVNGVLQAKDIIDGWFPAIDADVFLSHSHKDEELVIGFAGWLELTFGIKSFIDSTVWGYSDTLLKLIDDDYCKNKSTGMYNYDLRNRSTSHVHMMLSTALLDMIDRCECVVFINTPHSFKPADYLQDEGKTESPWIYSEIAMTKMLRQKTPAEHRPMPTMDSINASLEHLKEARNFTVHYPADLFHLTPLSLGDLQDWQKNEINRKRGAYALDTLYKMKEN
jgi:hypothetical protein